ncbi:Alpha/Beta hydrolase protein [Suillus clintonianus]|uniref:Alpha/Beta hydrolase protein n=1 Tax=Suillus clintonianus TaxID=1904413 RepID=UPI001B864980|nr:Alpha/Beta hydrolase protein [Suillus clintonianus]KAG2150414.1 Alpha/Beta hydrolase protein [Suillus clintonianus]
MLPSIVLFAGFVNLVSSAVVNDVRPLVIWHGLGDTYASPGMVRFENEVKEMHPGVFVHSIFIDEDPNVDQRATFYGNVNQQIVQVAQQLAEIPELSRGFDAIGFSQGGQFLRGYVERNNSPPVHNLITFGSQHMGVSDLPACKPMDLLCQVARRAANSGVYSEWAQEHLVQAQYFRDPQRLSQYISSGSFLPDINNEVLLPSSRNASYADNLASLNKLILVLFLQDKTVVPKESAWFGSEQPLEDIAIETSGSDQTPMLSSPNTKDIIPMRLQTLYREDWIGLRQLDESGGIEFVACQGEHMQIGDCWKDLVAKWVGGSLSAN